MIWGLKSAAGRVCIFSAFRRGRNFTGGNFFQEGLGLLKKKKPAARSLVYLYM